MYQMPDRLDTRCTCTRLCPAYKIKCILGFVIRVFVTLIHHFVQFVQLLRRSRYSKMVRGRRPNDELPETKALKQQREFRAKRAEKLASHSFIQMSDSRLSQLGLTVIDMLMINRMNLRPVTARWRRRIDNSSWRTSYFGIT